MFSRIIIDLTNQDCGNHVDQFYRYDTLLIAKMMTISKEFNLCAKYMMEKMHNKKMPKKGLMHMGRMLTPRNQEIAKKYMLPGAKNVEAAITMTCVLCDKRCPSISEYGFPGHSKCIRKKETIVNGRSSVIDFDMIPHIKSLRMRGLYTGGLTHYAMKEVIPGVFPEAMTLGGYVAANPVEVAKAREIAASITRASVEKREALRAKVDKQHAATKAEVEAIVGMPFQKWVNENEENTLGIFLKKTKTSDTAETEETKPKIPRNFVSNALNFKTGEEFMGALAVFQKFPFLAEKTEFMFSVKKGETIDSEKVSKKMEYFIKKESIEKEMQVVKDSQGYCAKYWCLEDAKKALTY